MARFYFDLYERGPTFEDHAGIALVELDEARQQAVRSAETVLGSEAPDGGLCVSCCVDVAKVAGATVVTVPSVETAKIRAR